MNDCVSKRVELESDDLAMRGNITMVCPEKETLCLEQNTLKYPPVSPHFSAHGE